MTAITADIKPVISGSGEWSPTEWMAWHKALVKKYNTASMLIKKDDLVIAKNPMAAGIFNQEWNKASFWGKVKNGISNPLSYKDEQKYFGMWADLAPFSSVTMQSYNPVFTGIQIAGEAAEGIYDFGKMVIKIAIFTGITVGVIALAIGGAYVYKSFKKTK